MPSEPRASLSSSPAPPPPPPGSGSGARSDGAHRSYGPGQILALAFFALLSAGALVAAVVALVLLPTLPDVEALAGTRLKVPMRVYAADGELIAEFGEEKRIPVSIEEAPETLVQAILAAEDHAFFQHHGVDFIGILRAAWHNLRRGEIAQGASTITMQVARNYFLSPEKTYTRKLKEVLLALKIERELSKQEILELYINKIFLGHRAYGFAAAAQVYYGKRLDELTLPEIAMLAGLPRAPSRDNPISNPDNALARRNYVLRNMRELGFIDEQTYQAARAAPLTAARHPIRYELDAGYVAEMARAHMYASYDEKTYADGFHVYTTIDSRLQRAANRALRKALLAYERRHGWRGPAGRVRLKAEPDLGQLDDALKDFRVVGGLVPAVVLELEERRAKVYTQDGQTVTLDWEALAWARPYVDENTLGPAPKQAADILQRGDIIYLERLEPAAASALEEPPPRYALAPLPRVSGALVALRASDGAILALAGGFDFFESSFNRATQAQRQPGSSLKPFIYAAALEKGFTPASLVSGAPIVIEDATLEDEWRPENYSRQFFGPTRLREALAKSLNLVSIRLLRAIGPEYAVEYLRRFGFRPEQLPRNLSLALGTASATPLEMARAFAVFANGGFLITPYFITRVEDAAGKVLEQARPAIACDDCPPGPPPLAPLASAAAAPAASEPAAAGTAPTAVAAPRVLSPELAFLMTDMLREVIRSGTGQGAQVLGRADLAGKTGTTNDYRDAWFSGFNSAIVATAWVGFDQPKSLGLGEAGARAALPMWVDFMRSALEAVPVKPLTPPPGIVKLTINRETGKPTTPDDPLAMEEYFIQGQAAGPDLPTSEGVPPGGGGSPAPPVPEAEDIRRQLF